MGSTYLLTEGCFHFITAVAGHVCSVLFFIYEWLFFYRYIYVSDLIHHNINVYERQEGEQLMYTKVISDFTFSKVKKQKH